MYRLSRIADGLWGLITTRRATRTGVGWTTLALLHWEGLLERVAHSVYRIRAAGEPDHFALRAAWLQLDPATPAWALAPRRVLVARCPGAT